MRNTENLGLALPDQDDLFDIGDINGNSEIIDAAFGGVTMRALTQQEYDAMTEHGENTLYVAHDGDTTKLYIGDTPITGGGGTLTAGETLILQPGELGTAGTVTEIEEE